MGCPDVAFLKRLGKTAEESKVETVTGERDFILSRLEDTYLRWRGPRGQTELDKVSHLSAAQPSAQYINIVEIHLALRRHQTVNLNDGKAHRDAGEAALK